MTKRTRQLLLGIGLSLFLLSFVAVTPPAMMANSDDLISVIFGPSVWSTPPSMPLGLRLAYGGIVGIVGLFTQPDWSYLIFLGWLGCNALMLLAFYFIRRPQVLTKRRIRFVYLTLLPPGGFALLCAQIVPPLLLPALFWAASLWLVCLAIVWPKHKYRPAWFAPPSARAQR